MSLRVTAAGPLTLIEDLGRPGYGADGIGSSGAMDAGSLALANRLVGNGRGAAGLEILGPGLELRIERELWFAVTGAPGTVLLDGREVDWALPRRAPAGSELAFGALRRGIRRYLAVRGGIDAPAALGSRATDTLSGIGPAPVAAGDVLALGRPAHPVAALDWMPLDAPGAVPGAATTLVIRLGPRAEWLAAGEYRRFVESGWTVSTSADRVGIRLEGAALRRSRIDELPSEGMIHGAVQLPPSGLPVIFGPDHPATGGYPVIAVVARGSLDALAHLVPGSAVHFTAGRAG